MSTSVPNFNFLALIVSEIWRGPKIKSGVLIDTQIEKIDNVDLYSASSLISPDAPYRKTFYLQIRTSVPNVNFIARLVSEI